MLIGILKVNVFATHPG
jgi:hypothetical protein